MEEDSMAGSATPQSEQSLGNLVAQAAKDMSQLIHYEIELAKSELKVDVRRIAIAAALGAFCALAGCLIVIMLCFGWAYLLHWMGAPGGMGGAFAFVALTVLVVAAIVGFVAYLIVRRVSGMKRTRKTIADDISMLRHARSSDDGTAAVSGGSPAAELPRRLGTRRCPPSPTKRSRSADRGHTVR
jgi:Putative Actinobacterial Holin-X, holin superfamily III